VHLIGAVGEAQHARSRAGVAEPRLRGHCERRKYLQRANSWFGLALGPDGSIRLVAELVGPWQFDAVRETAWGNAPAMRPMNAVVGKVGRNDPCPCGSGKKYKRCCFNR
jgi:hypothetical protein